MLHITKTMALYRIQVLTKIITPQLFENYTKTLPQLM